MPKKILFFIDCLRLGGRERRLIELLFYLKRNTDFQMKLVLMDKRIYYKNVMDLGIPIVVIERKVLKKDPFLFIRFYKVVREFRPDIIHTWGTMTTFYSLPTKLIFGCGLVSDLIASSPVVIKRCSLNNIFFRFDCVLTDKIVGNSEAGFRAFGISGKKRNLIYNGVRLERFNLIKNRDTICKELCINTKYIIIMVATINSSKRYDIFIDVAEQILNERDDITFIGLGDGSDKQVILNLLEQRHITNVKMIGARTDVEDIISIADIGVLFTKTEGISNSIIEYMALKKPVITTDLVGGSKEIISQNESGYILPCDIKLIKRYIEILISNSSLRDQLGKKGREIIESKFTVERMGKEYTILYDQL